MIVPLRLMLALAACALTAVLAGSLIATQAEQAVTDQVHDVRNNYLLSALRGAIEANLAIGLDIEQMNGLQAMIEREKTGAKEILAIDIYSPEALMLYSTDQGARGGAVSDAWRAQLESAQPWCTDTPYERSCGIRIEDDLGQAAAGLVITATRDTSAYGLNAWLARGLPTLRFALLAALGAALAGGLMGWIMLRPFRKAAEVLAAPPDAAPPAPAGDEPLARTALEARQTHLSRRAAIERDLLTLKDLDDAH